MNTPNVIITELYANSVRVSFEGLQDTFFTCIGYKRMPDGSIYLLTPKDIHFHRDMLNEIKSLIEKTEIVKVNYAPKIGCII